MAEMKQFNVELPEADIRRIKIEAVKQGITLSEFALRALRAALDGKKGKAQ